MLKKSFLLGTTMFVTAAIAMPATAQVDEIIVTATKREQTLQEIPIAVSVVPADTIQKAQILDIKDLQSVVPTLRITTLQGSSQSNFVIRGFGNGANNPGIEPSVGVFIDGVYRSRSAAQISDLPVLERVEVLSGPQSTLFGKNASAGVISVVTQKPSFETTGYAEVGYGNFDQKLAKIFISGPINDSIAGSLSGGINKRDGYSESLNPNVSDLNDRDRFNLRGDLLFQPTDNVEFRLTGDYNEIDENCCVANLIDVFDAAPPLGIGQPATGTPTFLALSALGLDVNDANDPFTYTNNVNVPSQNEIQDGGISFHADVNFDNGISLTSITAFRQNESFFDSDVDFSNVDFLPSASGDTNIKTFTQELRFNGTAFDDRVNWTLGGYYFDEQIDSAFGLRLGQDTRTVFNGLVGAGDPVAGGATLNLVELTNGFAPNTFFDPNVRLDEIAELNNDSYSLFGNLDFDVTDRFTLTVGGNYTEDNKNFSISQVNNEAFSDLNFAGEAGRNALPLAVAAGFTPLLGSICGLGPLSFTPENLAAIRAATACDLSLAPPELALPPVSVPGVLFVNEDLMSGGLFSLSATQAEMTDLTVPCAPGQNPPACNPLLALQALQFLPQFATIPNGLEPNVTNDSEFTYTIRGAYDVTDNINVYASYATGFKASSVNLGRDSAPLLSNFTDANGRPIAAAFATLPNNFSVRTTDGQLIDNTTLDADIPANAVVNPATASNFGTRSADPEETEAFEIGLKAKFEKGAFNVAIFDQTIKGFQSNVFIGSGFVLANAGEQSVRGVEWDALYRPVEPLTLTFGGAYLDAKYDDFQGSPNLFTVPTDRSGDEVQGISPLNLFGSATYAHDFGNDMGGYIRGDVQYESQTRILDSFNDLDPASGQINTSLGSVPFGSQTNFANIDRETLQFNFSAGLEFANGVQLQGYVRNAFNDERLISAFPVPGLAGLFFGYPNQPRTYGANLRYTF